MKLMTCRHHLHLNLTRQGHIMSTKLDHVILACALHPFLTCVLPLPVPYVSTWDRRGDVRGDFRHRARGSSGCSYDYFSRQGGDLPLPYNFPLTLPSCNLERCLILSTLLCHVSNPYNHDSHIPANHCTTKLPLLSHCLVCVGKLAAYRNTMVGISC